MKTNQDLFVEAMMEMYRATALNEYEKMKLTLKRGSLVKECLSEGNHYKAQGYVDVCIVNGCVVKNRFGKGNDITHLSESLVILVDNQVFVRL